MWIDLLFVETRTVPAFSRTWENGRPMFQNTIHYWRSGWKWSHPLKYMTSNSCCRVHHNSDIASRVDKRVWNSTENVASYSNERYWMSSGSKQERVVAPLSLTGFLHIWNQTSKKGVRLLAQYDCYSSGKVLSYLGIVESHDQNWALSSQVGNHLQKNHSSSCHF